MINRLKSQFFGLVFLFVFSFGTAQTLAPKYSNEFLKIGVGARAFAMGGAQVAHVNDVTAGYWNPAGLNSASKNPELVFMHSEYFAGIAKYDYGAVALAPDDQSHFALSVIRLGVDDIPNTLNLVDDNGNVNYDNIESFSTADLGIYLSYARDINLVKGLKLGATAKIINRNVGKFATAWGFGLDVGAQYKMKNGLQLGAAFNDVTSTFNAWSFNTETFQEAFEKTGNEIPENSLEITLPSMRLGVAYKFFEDRKFNLLLALDNATHFDGKRNVVLNLGAVSFDPQFGMEASYKNKVFLRAGFKNIQKEYNSNDKETVTLQPSVGLGFFINEFLRIDYALADPGQFSQTLYSHVFSLQFILDKDKLNF